MANNPKPFPAMALRLRPRPLSPMNQAYIQTCGLGVFSTGGGLGFSLIDPGTTDRSKHILIVEDDPSLRRVLRLLLETEGYRVSEAENGMTGLAILQHESPDLVILDVMMP